MYESVARIDSDELRARINREANQILDRAVKTDGKIDVAHGYAHPIAARTAAHLFGIPGPTEADLMRVNRALFHFSFLANPDELAVTSRAGRAAAEMRAWMTDEIARRRRDGIEVNDVLGRLLAIRDAAGTMLDAETARRILVGLLVGAIDTTSPTVPRIVYVLGSDPALLAKVERDVHDRQRMLGWCSEALRMWSSAPVLFRRAAQQTTIGGRVIPEGCKVAAFTQAAMFDPSVFPNPTMLIRPARRGRISTSAVACTRAPAAASMMCNCRSSSLSWLRAGLRASASRASSAPSSTSSSSRSGGSREPRARHDHREDSTGEM